MANHILIPESRADAILDEVGTVPPGEDGMTGSWNLDVMLKSGSRHIANDIAQILESHGYQDQSAGAPDYIHTGVNWGYTGAQDVYKRQLPYLHLPNCHDKSVPVVAGDLAAALRQAELRLIAGAGHVKHPCACLLYTS